MQVGHTWTHCECAQQQKGHGTNEKTTTTQQDGWARLQSCCAGLLEHLLVTKLQPLNASVAQKSLCLSRGSEKTLLPSRQRRPILQQGKDRCGMVTSAPPWQRLRLLLTAAQAVPISKITRGHPSCGWQGLGAATWGTFHFVLSWFCCMSSTIFFFRHACSRYVTQSWSSSMNWLPVSRAIDHSGDKGTLPGVWPILVMET